MTAMVGDHYQQENPGKRKGQAQQEPESALSQPEKGKHHTSDPKEGADCTCSDSIVAIHIG